MGVLVLARDYKKVENIAFFGISLGITGWAVGIAGFIDSRSLDDALVWAKFYYFFPVLLVFSLVTFAQYFLSQAYKTLKKTTSVLLMVLGSILSIALFSSRTFITAGIIEQDYGKRVILDEGSYIVYSAYLIVCFAITLLYCFVNLRDATSPVVKQQARLVFLGVLASTATGLYFNLLLPAAGNYRLIYLGPLFVTVFLTAVAYAIVKHKMFDVRWFVVRSVAYVISVLILSVVYIAPLLYMIGTLILDYPFRTGPFVFGVAVASLAALFYERVRLWFNSLTAKIFFREAYNPEQFIAELNSAIVTNLDLEDMLTKASEVIARNINAEYCLFGLKETDRMPQRVVGLAARRFSDEDVQSVRQMTPRLNAKVVLTDFLPPEQDKLKHILQMNDVAVLARLVSDANIKHEGLGYIVLGPKKGGDLYNTRDVRTLETIINGLIIAIQNALRFEEIQNFNATLQQRVEDATKRLRLTNAKLKTLDEAKDDFISMASHQLRTPLTSVKGYLSMVLEGDAGALTPYQRKLLEEAYTSSQRMVYLISDFLNVSRLKTGKFVLELNRANLANIVEEEVRKLELTAASRQLKINYQKPANLPPQYCDANKLRQVVMNLLDNAIFYSRPGGAIDVELTHNGRNLTLKVKDSGIGVPAAERHHLFGKFFRASNAKKARPDGTGIGLFMAKKVILAHGGSVIAETTEHKGSTFGFVLPLEPIAATQKQALPTPAAAKSK